MNPQDLLAERHTAYRKAADRAQRATTKRSEAQATVAEREQELRMAEARDRDALGDALVDGSRPPTPTAPKAEARLEAARRELDALTEAEQRALSTLTRLPGENRRAWLREAQASARSAQASYHAAIRELAAARQRLGDEAQLAEYIDTGEHRQPISGAVQFPPTSMGGPNTTIPFDRITEALHNEAGGNETRTHALTDLVGPHDQQLAKASDARWMR
jgi:hypothetical protein